MANISPPPFSPEYKKEVDDFFASLKKVLKNSPVPTAGVISFTRHYRRKTGKWLADQLHISPPAFHTMTENEKERKSNLKTLEKTAYALNCDLIYLLVPKD